jgi:hypothetical protein
VTGQQVAVLHHEPEQQPGHRPVVVVQRQPIGGEESGVVPTVSVGTAVRLVAQHCEHLGVTVDDMAGVLGWMDR